MIQATFSSAQIPGELFGPDADVVLAPFLRRAFF